MIKQKSADLDVYLLRRQFRLVGHIARIARREPNGLVARALNWGGGRFIAAMQASGVSTRNVFGPIGQSNNWIWEMQFRRFFEMKSFQRRDVAEGKALWRSFEREWCQSRMGPVGGQSVIGF